MLPDGTLQEAGSIIWNDGTCTGFGRGREIADPEVMFRRDVDFCSAAFLLTHRWLFEYVGPFDEAYAPAYYEEVDYCVRLWRAGYRVVYDPDILVLHYEFGSSSSSAEALPYSNETLLYSEIGTRIGLLRSILPVIQMCFTPGPPALGRGGCWS